ncbi:MAG: ABC-2 family transporter protein [Mycobacteriales bacterium]
MSEWGRYPRILAVCWRAAVSTELEYRANFVSNTVLSVFWVSWAAAGVSVYFQFSDSLAGWTYAELLVVIGLFFAVNGLRQAMLEPNLDRLGEYIRLGTLDFLLTKPVDSQLLVSLRHLSVNNLLDPLIGLALVTVGIVRSGHGLSAAATASFVVVFTAALALLYALMLALMAFTVVLKSADGVDQIGFGVVELSRFPVQLYRRPIQTMLTVAPVAFLTTFPALALLERLDPVMLLVSPAVAIASVSLATVLWRRAMRGYTGASA